MADSRNLPEQMSLPPTLIHPPASNPKTSSKLSARLYLPKTTTKKLPLLIYFYGGGFIIETTASPTYHNFLNLVASESNVVIVFVDYRTAPEHPVPTCFNDSWETIKWVAGNCPDSWVNDYADLEDVYFVGGNITHHMAIRVWLESPKIRINLRGTVLLLSFIGPAIRPEWGLSSSEESLI